MLKTNGPLPLNWPQSQSTYKTTQPLTSLTLLWETTSEYLVKRLVGRDITILCYKRRLVKEESVKGYYRSHRQEKLPKEYLTKRRAWRHNNFMLQVKKREHLVKRYNRSYREGERSKEYLDVYRNIRVPWVLQGWSPDFHPSFFKVSVGPHTCLSSA